MLLGTFQLKVAYATVIFTGKHTRGEGTFFALIAGAVIIHHAARTSHEGSERRKLAAEHPIFTGTRGRVFLLFTRALSFIMWF
uniref:Uncharacterized protein n=1 Tax=Ixodes ricinus TaxID=34613 RepID=A0A6B0TX83_IXORI